MTARHDVIVVGGGVAGLTAAVCLADAGARVLVLEARPQLGGRATAFVDRQTGEVVDNGQHVLFGCYRASLDLLRIIGAEAHVRRQPTLELVCYDRAGHRSTLRCPPLRAPLHLLAGVAAWHAIPWRERMAAARVMPPIMRARRCVEAGQPLPVAASETVQDWLQRYGQGAVLQEWLWHPLAVAALNQQPEHVAAEPFVRVLAEMFAPDPAAAAVVLPARPLDEMYAEPARQYILQRGGEVRTSMLARLVPGAGRIERVEVRGERFSAGHVIAAVPWFGVRTLFPDAAPPALSALFEVTTRMEPMPIVTVNLWYDRPVMDDAFVGLPGRIMQWVFDKRIVLGGAASHLSLVSSGASAVVGCTNEELTALAAREVEAGLPGARGVWPVRATVIREKRATFSLAPGRPARPGARTPLANLFLAGDWTDTGLPATIESAAISGRRAAEVLMQEAGGSVRA